MAENLGPFNVYSLAISTCGHKSIMAWQEYASKHFRPMQGTIFSPVDPPGFGEACDLGPTV